MHDGFAALLQQPTARRYKQLRSRLLAVGSPSDFSLQLAELKQAVASEDFDQATLRVAELLKREGLLSLQLHRLGGIAALKLEDRERAELHRFSFDAICDAIATTGCGTRQKPWIIAYPSDAAEFLAARGCEALSQSLVEDDGRRFDVVLCKNEREFWFDVTDLLPATALVAVRRTRPAAAVVVPVRKKAVSRSRR